MPKIDKMFAFVTEDRPGSEGVTAFGLPGGGWMPMVGADMARVESLRNRAQEIADRTGSPITIVEFSTRNDIETIMPKKK